MYTFGEEIEVVDRTPGTFQLTLAGPEAEAALRAAVGSSGAFTPPERDNLARAAVAGADVVVWRMLNGGSDVFEIVGERTDAERVSAALSVAGAVPVSAVSWEVHRIESGMPAYGAEFGAFTNPLESGLAGAISDEKGCYTGQEVIARLLTYRKVQRRLMSLALSGPASPGAKADLRGRLGWRCDVGRGDVRRLHRAGAGLRETRGGRPYAQRGGRRRDRRSLRARVRPRDRARRRLT